MKKNKVFLSILVAVIVSALFVCAKIEAETQVLSDTLYTFIADFPATIIKHTPITNVSIDIELNGV